MFCGALLFAAGIFIFITVQNYQQASASLQEQIDALEKREVDLRVSLELEKTRQDEFEAMLAELEEEARGLIAESNDCTTRLQTGRQLEQKLELESQKAQFKRDQKRTSRLGI